MPKKTEDPAVKLTISIDVTEDEHRLIHAGALLYTTDGKVESYIKDALHTRMEMDFAETSKDAAGILKGLAR